MRVEYRVLGPLEVLVDGVPVTVPAGRCRVLLATLLLRANEFVSPDELVDRLWDGVPPSAERAGKTLHMVVARLRQALGRANRVRTGPGGYAAVVTRDELDLLAFRRHLDDGEHTKAAALWRGPVLGNVVSESLHRDAVPALREAWLAVVERRVEADLERGLAGALVPELRALTAQHPLREVFWAQLVLALHRSGQQADALAALRQVTRELDEQLGVRPGRSGEHQEAVTWAVRAREMFLDLVPDEKDTMAAANRDTLAGAYRALGRHAEAEENYLRSAQLQAALSYRHHRPTCWCGWPT